MKEYHYINTIKRIIDTELNIIGDDTAIIKDSGLVLTCDTLVENVHFDLKTTSAQDLGYKAGAVNLSDIAASGGNCDYLLVSLALPSYLNDVFIEEFYKGLKTICDRYQCRVVGGDLVSCKQLVITITAIGNTKASVSRGFAKPGQYVLTTGNSGNSRMGLELLMAGSNLPYMIKNSREYQVLTRSHIIPDPRMNESQFIINTLNYDNFCMMDTSDGLADAILQISKKSDVHIDIDIMSLPISNELKIMASEMHVDVAEYALFGGEDFELVFTVDQKDLHYFKNNDSFKFTVIGKVCTATQQVNLLYPASVVELTEDTLERTISFKHF